MLDFIRQIRKPKYEPLNRIEIIQQNILDNYEYLKSINPQVEIFPVLKANAYGHGLKQTCQILNQTDVKMVAVDSYPEAQIVYKYFNGKVLILSQMPLGAYKYCKFDRTEFCVYNLGVLGKLGKLGRLGKKAKVHLFVNTGMNREGIQEVDELVRVVRGFREKVEIVGLCSHLASAEQESQLNREQEQSFLGILGKLDKGNFKWVHLANSAGHFVLDNKKFNAARIGLAMYGYNIFDKSHSKFKLADKLKPALRVISKVVAVQKVNPGDKVSYNEKFIADKPGKIAVIPFGYYEGLDRGLSNQADFLINQEFYAKVVGNICMNLTCLDCGQNKVKVGDEVEVISANPQAKNSVQNLVKLIDTIPYEVLVRLQGNIRREII